MKKCPLLLTILLLNGPLYAQQTSLPRFQLGPEIGYSYSPLNKSVYTVHPYKTALQPGLMLRFRIAGRFSLGLEAQQRRFNLQDKVQDVYGSRLAGDPLSVSQFSTTTIRNGLLLLCWNAIGKQQRSLFEIGVGGGMQQLKQEQGFAAFHNPYQLGALDTLYRQSAVNQWKPMAQLSLSHTWFIKRVVGVRVALKLQYAPNLYEVKNRETDAGQRQSFEAFCRSTTITQTIYNPVSITPSVGINIPVGWRRVAGGASQDNKSKKSSCFTLTWKNKPSGDACFSEAQLKFGISISSNMANVAGYEVYLAPQDDLGNTVLISNLPHPTSSFTINTGALLPNRNYVVMVKLIYANQALNCLQRLGPVRICNRLCPAADNGQTAPVSQPKD